MAKIIVPKKHPNFNLKIGSTKSTVKRKKPNLNYVISGIISLIS